MALLKTMKKLIVALLIVTIVLTSCGKEEPEPVNEITADVIVVEELIEEPEPERIVTTRLCHDTDRATNIFVPGKTFGFYANAERFEFEDYCESENYVIEYSCEEEDPKNQAFLCRNGCHNGACR